MATKRNINEILPVSMWDKMAESDVLIEYLRKFDDSIINTDVELRDKMINSLYSYSNEIIPEVEQYFAEQYYNSLKVFLDKIKEWKNQKQ
jgi:hypothetical protein